MTEPVGEVHIQRHGLSGKHTAHPALGTQECRRLTAGLVFQQLSGKFPAGVLVLFMFGKQFHRLDIDQPGCHLDEFAAHFQVCFLHLTHSSSILFHQGGNLDVVDIELVPGNQGKDQVKRAFHLTGPEGKFLHLAPPTRSAPG